MMLSFLKRVCWGGERADEKSCILYVSLLWVISVRGTAGHKIGKIKITAGGRPQDCNGIASSCSKGLPPQCDNANFGDDNEKLNKVNSAKL